MSKWTISTKIACGFVLVLVLTLSMGLFNLWMTNRTSAQLSLVTAEYLPEAALAAEVERDLLNTDVYKRQGADRRHVQRLHPGHLRDVARDRRACRVRRPPRPQSDV